MSGRELTSSLALISFVAGLGLVVDGQAAYGLKIMLAGGWLLALRASMGEVR